MTYELIVFDMAGTTVKDKGNVNEAFRAAFSESGIEVSAADVDTVMGYRKVEAIEISPLPQVMETFAILKAKGCKIALNTGFTRVITDVILKRLGWVDSNLIDAVVCSDEVQEGRPHPFMIRRIMDLVGVAESAKVVKVGDTSVDVLEGQFAGCGLVIAVTTGAYTKEQLMEFQPDKIIDNMQELPALIA